MRNAPKVAILMLTHNAPGYVFKSIWTLRRVTSSAVRYELIVVDNGSRPLTRFILRLLRVFGFVNRLKCSRTNLMFAKGNNEASRMVSQTVTHYCLLNSDVEIRSPSWLERLYGYLDGDVGIAAFGAVQSEPVRADGYCLLIRRSLFDRYKLDESFEWFWSITKLQAQVRREGLGVVAVRDHEECLHYFGGKSKIDFSKKVMGMDIDIAKVIGWFDGVLGNVRIIDHCEITEARNADSGGRVMPVRKIIRKLMMLSPGYRKAFFVEQKLEQKSAELLAAIEAVRPADRTGELLAAIEAARPADRTGELLAAIEAARPADRTGELLAAIEALRLEAEKRMESLRILQESRQTNLRVSEFLNLYNQHAESAVPVDDHFVSYTYPTVFCGSYGCNLGDYVQTIATESAISRVIGREALFRNVRRDQLTAHDGGTCVMQGWYEHGVLSFLPNATTRAVWVGTHFETATQEALRCLWSTSPATIPYEIGCRDMATLEFCERLHIRAYFSRCLTLVLPRRDTQRQYKEVYLVECPDWLLSSLPPELRDGGQQITQRNFRSPSPSQCRVAAQTLLSRYRDTARLVITTALHCALPCAAMGIPVVLVNPGYDEAERFSVAQGILPVYSRGDLLSGNVDFNPSAVDIEELKRDILLNLKLSLAVSRGELADGSELASVRQRIRDFKLG